MICLRETEVSLNYLTVCRVADEVSRLVPELVARLDADLAHLGGSPATKSWPDYGEIVLVASREEAVRLSDRYAPGHLEVQAEDLDWYHQHLLNYGSLFLGSSAGIQIFSIFHYKIIQGEGSTVTHGDKASGLSFNHFPPNNLIKPLNSE